MLEYSASPSSLDDSRASAPAPRIALICDLLEENWPSMDLVGDLLFENLTEQHVSEWVVTKLRPLMRRRFTRIPIAGGGAALFNADRLLNRFVDYPRWLKRGTANFDLFHIVDHSYAQLVHYIPAGRTVVTCHDLDAFRCLLEPQLEPRSRWFRAMTERILKGLLRAAHVICPSEATRSQILHYALFPPDRVSVIYSGVDPVFLSPPDPLVEAEVDRLLGPDRQRPYLLHVGSSIPRKRIDVLLRVFAAVRKECPDVNLVRVGGPFTSVQKGLVDRLRLNANITVMPFLDRKILAGVYRRAALLLQPSDAEGFGLPLIEAMACGCPVVASDLPVLHEAGGLSCSYCPVADIDAWASTVVRRLGERQQKASAWNLRQQRAMSHAAGFSWGEAARKTACVYREVLKGAPRN